MIQFSICIPNFNYSGYIGETIESVLNQTYQHFEIVIVDNASTDNSWEIIQSYVSKDNRIKAYRNLYNVGFAPNLDKAAQKANNPFIIMLSADDTMNSNALEEYNLILCNNSIDKYNLLLCSSVNIIDSNSIIIGEKKKIKFHNIPNRAKYKPQFSDSLITDYDGLKMFEFIFPRFSVPGSFNSTLYSKELYERVGGYGSTNLIGPDGHFAYKCLLTGAEVIYIDKLLFNYRVHNSGQLKLSKKNKNINILIDRYIFSNAYSDIQLEKANLKRIDFQKATLKTDCINGAMWKLKEGDWVFAFRHFCFGFSAYPTLAFKSLNAYIVFLLLILGPIGILLAKIVMINRK